MAADPILSLQDLNVSDKVVEITKDLIETAEKKTAEIIENANSGKLEAVPGKSLDETRETKIMQVLNGVRTDVSEVVKVNFPTEGNVNKMIKAGCVFKIRVFRQTVFFKFFSCRNRLFPERIINSFN